MLVALLCLFECDTMSKLSCMGTQDLSRENTGNTKIWDSDPDDQELRTQSGLADPV